MTIAARIQEHWREFKRAQPGERFQARYRRRQRKPHNLLTRMCYTVLGIALLIVGVILLPAPGPGFLVLIPGAALIAEESQIAARALDWLDVKLRRLATFAQRTWTQATPAVKAMIVGFALVAAAIAGWAGYVVLLA